MNLGRDDRYIFDKMLDDVFGSFCEYTHLLHRYTSFAR